MAERGMLLEAAKRMVEAAELKAIEINVPMVIYNANGFDIALVQRLLQHSSAATTQRYIGIEPQRIEQAIQNHAQLL